MKIIKKKITVNGQNYEVFPYPDGREFTTLEERLEAEFKTQGDFYELVYGADRRTAERAGWHPEDKNFSNICSGWAKFLKDKGITRSEEEIFEVEISDILFE